MIDGGLKIALAGNPNVGKSTVFNALTGLKQHTGNWAGKTVENAAGECRITQETCMLMDIPGTYSLIARSKEEEVACDYICFSDADAVIVVCDAGCLERNLNLALQICEVTGNVIICVNLIDEAQKMGIEVDEKKLSRLTGCPCVKTAARSKKGIKELAEEINKIKKGEEKPPLKIDYGPEEEKIKKLEALLYGFKNPRWCAVKLLEGDSHICSEILKRAKNREEIEREREKCGACEIKSVERIYEKARQIADACIKNEEKPNKRRLIADRLLTGRFTGIPLMCLMLAAVFFITVTLANYPSELLEKGLNFLAEELRALLNLIRLPQMLVSLIIDGVCRVLFWVVSVMLPPMAIFFPLFTLLEDAGYLPRVAFNMDTAFKRCGACGKQSLTMCMGFGCNAVGVTGARIIDSKRERLIAIITNSMVPCNGRFPMMITLISLFLAARNSLLSAVILTGIILLGVAATFFTSWVLSKTVLKGVPSSFTLELPPFRRPKVGEVIVRSIFDRTLFVLKRAAAVAAPAGLVIWLLANISAGENTLLYHLTGFFEPAGKIMGMDGVILTAFILALPANEIVLPLCVMMYTAGGSLVQTTGGELFYVLTQNGWTALTALCVVIFSLLHWPCSTTLMTVKKETGSLFYTVLCAVVPTLLGAVICMLLRLIF